jgi:hypothetical protein
LPWSQKDKSKRHEEPASFKESKKSKGQEKPKQKEKESNTEIPDVGLFLRRKGKVKNVKNFPLPNKRIGRVMSI